MNNLGVIIAFLGIISVVKYQYQWVLGKLDEYSDT